MATSSLLGGPDYPEHVRRKDTNARFPSDNSDSGSDARGAYNDDEISSDSLRRRHWRALYGRGRTRPVKRRHPA